MNRGNSHGYCINTCKQGQTSCDNGTGSCVSPRVDVNLCIPTPQGQERDACSEKLDDPKLDPKRICSRGLLCKAGICQKPKEVGVDEICSQEAVCKVGTRCVNAPNASRGVCAPQVTSCQQPGVCETGRTCLPTGANSAACVRICGANRSCSQGLRCVHVHSGPRHLDLCLP